MSFPPSQSIRNFSIHDIDTFSQSAINLSFENAVLKLTESAIESLPIQTLPANADTPGLVLTGHQAFVNQAQRLALHRLLHSIKQLRSPQGGWPETVPQTPENLLPYVEEEAQDLLHVLQADVDTPQVNEITAQTALSWTHWHDYFTIRQLAPWLLWCVARASSGMMQLMEGIVASIAQSDYPQQTGILRLIVVLDICTPTATCALDLATGRLVSSSLPGDTLIQSEDCTLCREAIAIDGLKQRVEHYLLATIPEATELMRGLGVNVLIPGESWQSGSVCFRLDVEFIADADDMAIDRMLEAEILSTIAEIDLVASREAHSIPALQPLIRLSNPNWLEHYAAAVLNQHLLSQPNVMSSYTQLRQQSPNAPTDTYLVALIQDVYEFSAGVEMSLSDADYDFIRHELRLNEFVLQLMWCFSRSAFEMMQLISGVRATVLQPGCSWGTGTLRLLVTLQVETPELEWSLDIATGRPATLDAFPLHPQAIAQANDCRWCESACLVNRLGNRVEQVWRSHPDLSLWLDGTDANVLVSSGDWQPCTIQVRTSFEFIPDLTPAR
ncbi:MAG: hypothetical protein ACFE0I_18600 [Elainellaceae cyanobacterium]